MATEKCNVSFQIRYTSSIPATDATAVLKYRIKDSLGSYTQQTITSVPASGGSISVSNIQASDDYEYILDLTANGIKATKTGFFQVGKCSPPYCEIPDIKRVYLGEEDRIIMEYPVDETDLYAIEYQIAKDDNFTNIVHVRIVMKSDYKPLEYIEMNDGTIDGETTYYIRARRHCSKSVVSAWSNIVEFRSGKKAAYIFEDAYCVSDAFKSPIDSEVMGASICWTARNPLLKTIKLSTPVPQIGSFIYLKDDVIPPKPAVPGSLMSFDEAGGPNSGFNERGIRWIRFGSDKLGNNPSIIYNVNPKTGEIVDIYSYCAS
ncbi:hypothetical protein [Chryseobacterium balustinum]|uniref:hypothetical protein n=1 Tax=Chryseobacterium balustinum TaxID=246 RepID=UPI003CF916EA